MAVEAAVKAPAARERGRRKVEVGVVTSAKMQKTIAVLIQSRKRHPQFEKMVSHQTVLKAHDEKGEAKEGDLVEVVETRPLSKTKRWRLVKIVRKAQVATVTGAEDTGDASKAKGGHKGKHEKAEKGAEAKPAGGAKAPAAPAKGEAPKK